MGCFGTTLEAFMIGCHVSILSNLLQFVYYYSNSYDDNILTINLYLKVKIKYLEVLWKKQRILHINLART